MTRNKRILTMLKEIIQKDFGRKIWQIEYLLQYIMENPESINNLSKGADRVTCEKFVIDSGSVDKNISRLIPYIDIEKLSEITGRNTDYIDIETLTPAKLIDIMVMYLKEEEYSITS